MKFQEKEEKGKDKIKDKNNKEIKEREYNYFSE